MGRYCFGIDVGGTTVKIGLFDEEGGLLEKWEIPTRTAENGKNILPDIAKALRDKLTEKKLSREDVLAAGIAVPGPVEKDGTVHRAANLGWGEFNLAEDFSKLTGFRTVAGNDATVAVLGEMADGGGKGCRNLVLATLGTGLGGGIIIDGQALYGSKGAGAEIGHMHFNDDETEVCGCGNKGCFEQYASATGLVRIAKKALAATEEDSALRGKEVTAKAIYDEVKNGDPLAKRIAEEYEGYLGKGFAMIAAVVDPEVFLIGGGVSKAGEILLPGIEKQYRKYAFHANQNVEFKLATLGNDAGIYGAMRLVLNED